MRKDILILLIILTVSFAGYLIYYYVFNIYEVTFAVNPKSLYADNTSTLTITSTPLNSLGFKAPLRNSSADFEISEGKELVEIIYKNTAKGILTLKSKNESGKVTLIIRSEHSLFPSVVEIPVYPNLAWNKIK